MSKLIDKEYFTNYADTGKHYREVWKDHTRIELFLDIAKKYNFKHVLVLGSATGEILHILDDADLSAMGVEKNKWAMDHSSWDHAVFDADMTVFVSALKEYSFDIMFSNSLAYLKEEQIAPFLKECAKKTKYFFFVTSLGEPLPDEYREITKPYSWWVDMFLENGYERASPPYLWKVVDFESKIGDNT